MKTKMNQRQRELFTGDRRHLAAHLERADIDEQRRTVPITIASETAVSMADGLSEILRHTPASIDLSRAENGLPLQVAHHAGELPVGRVESIHLDGARLRGLARFSKSARASEAWQDVLDGILRDVSVGAHVEHWEPGEGGTMIATRWAPMEVSLVAMGADPAAGINRTTTTNERHVTDSPTIAPTVRTEPDTLERAEAVAALFSGLDGEAWLTMERDALRAGTDVEIVRGQVLEALKSGAAPTVARDAPDTVIRAGEDGVSKWAEAAEKALEFKIGLVAPEHRREAERELASNELGGMTLREMARDYLRVRGVRTAGLTPDRLVSQALTMPALVRANFSHSTSDFANLLGSSAEKMLSTGYEEAPETYAAWTRNVTMNNFRAHSFTNMSMFGDLAQIREGDEYTYGTFSDRVNTATLSTYGKGFSITRRAIIDDDLNAFSDIPRRMGRAAARQVGDLVYAVLTNDTKLTEQAGATLFNTTDGNLAASATVIDTANMGIARKSLRTMTDPSGATLNIQPAYLLVPAAIETVAQVFLRTAAAPGVATNDVNVFQNSMQLVVEPRLDADDVNAWYVLAQPGGEVDTVVVGWLDGRQEPFLEAENGFDVDGIKYKVRIDCTAAALDWRGMYQNAGA